ncbi:hypothetical protein B0H67DRAFT_566649 [Lasiosphaeris hirsuta]|uniref:Uncharacterized protein n=1 Tax=Lasiosphaeris hirsuta TaxID=260670 RepID=A0AA40BD99_9PEZI|nr:hypothetical protein B0H67DRAFT_566649 [Lasiosphaeris hirsuta]
MSDDAYDSPYGYNTVGLGIQQSPGQQQRPGYVSQEPFLGQPQDQASPQFPDTPRTYYQSNDYLLGSPRPQQQFDQSPYQYDQSYGQQAYGVQNPPAPSSKAPRKKARWGWEWTDSSWVMYGLLLFGIVVAASHHIFYSKLVGKPADDQLKMMRFGTLFAYIAKSSLVSAVIFSYRQQIWVTVRKKTLKLRTIDNLFAAVEDLRAVASWELAKQAKVALGLAIIAWLFPLVIILTPATLTVAPLTQTDVTNCSAVRTLNFELEKDKNWRLPQRINGFPGLSLSLWNNTMPLTGEIFDPFNSTFFDYWTGSSWQTSNVVTLSAYSTAVVPRENVSAETCGVGWNCSYTISFTGPGYKCEQLARGRNDNTAKLKELQSPFDTTSLIPDGDFSYISHATLGEYSAVQIEAEPGGIPLIPPPFPKNLGAFRTEPVLWVGHSDLVNPSDPVPEGRVDPKFNSSFIPVIFRCEHYVTKYTVQFNHTYSAQNTKVLSREYIRPVVNTTFLPGVDANDGTKDNITATPESNYIMPLDVDNYRIAGAYHSLGAQMRGHINGTIQYSPYVLANTEAMKTRLINKATYLTVPNLRQQVQAFYENILLSLLNNPQFVVVAWAANETQRSGPANETVSNDPALGYPCVKTRVINAYAYNVRDLWIVYTFAIVACIVSVVLGALALADNNNHVRDTKFSSIVATTRAPCLEDLPWTTSKWGEVPKEVRETRMGYGVVSDEGAGGRGTPSVRGTNGEGVAYGFAPVEVIDRARTDTMISTAKSPATSSVISFGRRRK